MKTKLFSAFIIIIIAALFSNFIFERLIIKDFDNYVYGVKEDQFYWIIASVEGSYTDKGWDAKTLLESVHWAMMLGFDIKVLNSTREETVSDKEVIESLSSTMKHRMQELFHIDKTEGEYEEYPLYSKGERIGTLLSRPLQKIQIKAKESIFKRRTKNFLFASFLIAGSGLLLLAILFSQYLTKPLAKLKTATEKIASGNFNIRIKQNSNDEVGKVSKTFNIMAESLQKEEELRKHLMSNVAHELRTPLTVMKANVEAMADGIIDIKKQGLDNVKNEIDQLINLVKGIEDISMAEATFFTKKEKTEINLKEFLSGLIEDMRAAFKEKGLEIKIIKNLDLFVITDIEKLEKIIKNIVSNALKFTEKGGIWIDYGKTKETFFIEVKDSGKGIPENDVEKIFNRFYKVEKSKDGGLGLGLAIVKELVDVMGGTIEIKSKINEGTIFRIYFPISEQTS